MQTIHFLPDRLMWSRPCSGASPRRSWGWPHWRCRSRPALAVTAASADRLGVIPTGMMVTPLLLIWFGGSWSPG